MLGSAYIELGLSLPSSATKAVETAASQAGTAAGKGFTSSAEKHMNITAAAKKAGAEGGAAMTKEIQSAASKMRITTPTGLTKDYAKAGSEAGKALADSASKATASIDVKAPDVSSDFAKEGDKAGKSLTSRLKSATSGIGAIGGALGTQLIAAFDSEVDLSQTTRNFQQQLGTTTTEAKRLGLAAGSLYANGLADGMEEAEGAISSVVQNISGIRDQGLPAIKELAEGALGISRAFGQDVDATLRATGQLMRTGLAKDGKEALDIIAGGLQRIPGSAEDLLDTFQEYSVQFQKLGLSGKDALGVISQLMEGGARNTDLAADAMKEFSIRAVDGSNATKEAFTSLGLDADKLTRKFAEGGPEARKAFGEVAAALNAMEDPLKRNAAGVDLFGTQFEDLGDAFRKADLNKAKDQLGDLNGVADQIGGNTFGEKMSANLSKLSGVIGTIAGTLGIGFTASFDAAMDFSESRERIARDLGLSKAQAQEIGKAAGQLYAQGLGDSMSGVTAAIAEVGKAMPNIAKQGVPALTSVAEAALRLQKRFGIDIPQSTNAVGKLIKTGLVKNATEGFDLIAVGMQKIPRAGEDLIDTVNEYSLQFQKLGLSGKDTFGLIQQLMKGGARDTDLAADALKEFSIRAVDDSKTTKEAFSALGLNAENLTKTFAKGGPEARKSFGEVVTALNAMEDPVKRNAAGVALFGTQWEDLGGAFKSLNLDTAAAGLGKIDGANKQVRASTPTETVKQFQRAIEVAFVEVLANKVIPAFSSFVTFVKNNEGLLKTLAVAVGVVSAAYVVMNAAMAVSAGGGLLAFMKTAITSTKAWAVAQAALNLVMNANPIGIVVTAIAGLVAALVLLYQKNETVRKIIDAVWAGIKTAISAVADWFTKTAWPALKTAVDAVGAAFKWLYDTIIKPVWEGIKTAISTVWNFIRDNIFNPIMAFIKGPLAAVWNFLWKNVIQPVWTGIKLAIEIAWVAIQLVFKSIQIALKVLEAAFNWYWKNVIVPVWNGVKAVIQTVWNFIRDNIFNPMMTFIRGVLTATWNFLWKNVIQPVWNGIKLAIQVTWNFIRDNIFNPIIAFIKGPLNSGWNWLWKNVVVPVWNGIKTAISTGWNWIRDKVFTPLGNFLTKNLPGYFDKGASAIGKAWDKVKEVARKPVEFVVNTVIRDGIVKGFNAVATKVGVSPISFAGMATGGVVPAVNAAAGGRGNSRGFARGGVLPGYTPGRDVHEFVSRTGGRLMLSGGEAIMRPEWTRMVGGPRAVAAMNRYARHHHRARRKPPRPLRSALLGMTGGFANGGVIGYASGGVLDTLGSWWEGLSGTVKSATSIIGDFVGKAKDGAGSGWLGDLLKKSISTLMTGVKDTIMRKGVSSVGSVAIGTNGESGTGYSWQIAALRKLGLSPRVTSTTGGSHTAGSWHYRGRAIDIGNESMAMFNAIKKNFGTKTKELIYGPAGSGNIKNGRPFRYSNDILRGHFDHIHWAMKNGGIFGRWASRNAGSLKYDSGGWLKPGQSGVNLGSRPEAVLTPEESAGLKGMGVGEFSDKIDELIAAVERIAPGVGGVINGVGNAAIIRARKR